MNKEQNNIYAALARAQSTFKEAQKNGYNPHFKSYFSTFEDLVVASRESLTREGLSICQYLDYCFDNDVTYYVTQLQHSSGEIIKGKSRILLKDPTDRSLTLPHEDIFPDRMANQYLLLKNPLPQNMTLDFTML